jgi:hypothetical protein
MRENIMSKPLDTNGELLDALRKQQIPAWKRRQIVRKATRIRRRKEGQRSPRSVAGFA